MKLSSTKNQWHIITSSAPYITTDTHVETAQDKRDLKKKLEKYDKENLPIIIKGKVIKPRLEKRLII